MSGHNREPRVRVRFRTGMRVKLTHSVHWFVDGVQTDRSDDVDCSVLPHAIWLDSTNHVTASIANDNQSDAIHSHLRLSEGVELWVDTVRAMALPVEMVDQEIDRPSTTFPPCDEPICKIDWLGDTPAHTKLVNVMHRFRYTHSENE